MGVGSKGSNISAVWTPHINETLIKGVMQGWKQTDPRGASALSRMQIWAKFLDTLFLSHKFLKRFKGASTYRELKSSKVLKDRHRVKEEVKEDALRGWSRSF